MNDIVVADASCLIGLDNIGRSEILPRLYSRILIPPAVHEEFGKYISFVEIITPIDQNLIASLSSF